MRLSSKYCIMWKTIAKMQSLFIQTQMLFSCLDPNLRQEFENLKHISRKNVY